MSDRQDTIYVTYIKARAEAVWAALTQGAQTEKYFFGRRVESSWAVGAAWTLFTADGGKDVWGTVLEAEPPRRLAVTWEVNMPPGAPPLPATIVSYDIESIGEVVKLTMTEHHAGPIEERFLEGGRQGWPRILSGLKTLLETGAPLALPVPQPPAAPVMKSRFFYVTYIRAPAEKIWDALTKPEFTREYWAGTYQKSDWSPGSPWAAYAPDGRLWDSGEIIESDRPRKLVLTWRKEAGAFPEMAAEGYTRLTYLLEPADDAVKLTLTHEIDVENSKIIAALGEGWPGVLASLKSLLETGAALEHTKKWPQGL